MSSGAAIILFAALFLLLCIAAVVFVVLMFFLFMSIWALVKPLCVGWLDKWCEWYDERTGL